MASIPQNLCVPPGTTIRATLEAITKNGRQVALVTDPDDRLLGIVTDGDVRKALLRGASLEAPIGEHMNATPMTGRAEIVLPYPVNSNVRGPARHLVSRVYVGLLNHLFGLRVRYYNGTVIHRTANLKELAIKTSSFAYQAEILIKLLCAGKSFVEVPIQIDPPKEGRRSRAFRWKNMVQVGRTLGDLFLDIRIRRPLGLGR